MTSTLATRLLAFRRKEQRQYWAMLALLVFVVLALTLISLIYGETVYSLSEVWQVILGHQVPGASFAVGELRLPRALLALVCGMAFGAGGITFQIMLRNELASPDIIGVTAGASAAGVICITVFHLSQWQTSLYAVITSLVVSLLIYLLSLKGGFAGARLILIGIAMAALLQSVVTYTLSRAASWDLPTATHWLTGSLNNASWDRLMPTLFAAALTVPVLSLLSNRLAALKLGDDLAAGLGVNLTALRVVSICTAVFAIAVATAACGLISFVSFLAGPIAARLIRTTNQLVLPAALIGAVLILGADLIAQFALGARYPVGVVTGVLGAPFLIYLLWRSNKEGSL